MFAQNRRKERKQHVLDAIKQKFNYTQIIDLSFNENNNIFLEGTGSMVLDRDKKIAYACLSPRTDKQLLQQFCTQTNYSPVSFSANSQNGNAIYHTNVMMCVADKFVVICLETIINDNEKKEIIKAIEQSGKEIITLSFAQMNHFAGNMLQVINNKGQQFLIMSTQAYVSLNAAQIKKIESFCTIIHSDIATIETNGGGSARCMMAEVFLPLK
jgi:hypothetical protein